ncbi:CGNR zinc finger domain-containing protein [Humidisolicoccus flavus]|uniref:CGNR zinc finger domain-containing protein n=1 Tax=Humidisolicoccus flavus TaxID=3111414 RepID=UPI00324B0F44
MTFHHDHQVGPRLAAALVNATTPRAYESLLVQHGVRKPSLTTGDEQALGTWVGVLRTVFTAPDLDARCAASNELLAQAGGALYLSTHDGTPPHLHLAPDEHDVVARVRSVTAGGIAFFVAWGAGRRMGVCARPGCERVFIDVSRAGRQRYCTARCGNTDAVSRHRGRIH